MTSTEPVFQDDGIFEVEYLKNGTFYGQSYYSTYMVTLTDL